MKHLLFLFLIITTCHLQAQDSSEAKTFRSGLYMGEVMKFGNKSIKFRELISDSRCPRSVTCIWAGEAKVLVEVFENGKPCGTKVLTLASEEGLPTFLQEFFPAEMISLNSVTLYPYPEAPGALKPGDYRLDLEVKVKYEK